MGFRTNDFIFNFGKQLSFLIVVLLLGIFINFINLFTTNRFLQRLNQKYYFAAFIRYLYRCT